MDFPPPADNNRLTSPALLIGNSFPWALVERAIRAEPVTVEELQTRIAAAGAGGLHSFWGHPGTLAAASAVAGADLKPRTPRPAVTLDENRLPSLDGLTFREVWLISPRVRDGVRIAEGVVLAPEDVERWQVLRIVWL